MRDRDFHQDKKWIQRVNTNQTIKNPNSTTITRKNKIGNECSDMPEYNLSRSWKKWLSQRGFVCVKQCEIVNRHGIFNQLYSSNAGGWVTRDGKRGASMLWSYHCCRLFVLCWVLILNIWDEDPAKCLLFFDVYIHLAVSIGCPILRHSWCLTNLERCFLYSLLFGHGTNKTCSSQNDNGHTYCDGKQIFDFLRLLWGHAGLS